ncbi:caspase family protein [Microcoleus sp. B5-D4]|uniref:nSTAND1 domain-containing NTPase n=1 Tax=unclassified Microcoleus TaxID=2642155 RepID=UPI002FD3A4B5
MANFQRNWAVVIGINDYQNQVPKLKTAKNDAEKLADILAESHKYEVILITDDTDCKPNLESLLNLLTKQLPEKINKDDRLLFYFAGHGIAKESDRGPAGFLVPQDADVKNNANLLPMQTLHDRLAALKCRHLLVILDCCFAGTFRWSSTRKVTVIPRKIHQEHYDRFINSPAWQAITSAAHNQEAYDINPNSINPNNRELLAGKNHSPFAEALFKALQGEADIMPPAEKNKPAGDGVVTATELSQYLQYQVAEIAGDHQTTQLWPLPKHNRGEYIFLHPDRPPNLKSAPELNKDNNPYRGLESFEEKHAQFFFGRQELIKKLEARISQPQQPLTVVLGVSGAGKSSLVKAGLIPCLKHLSEQEVSQNILDSACNLTNVIIAIIRSLPKFPLDFWAFTYIHHWHILTPMRPGESPFTALARTIFPISDFPIDNELKTVEFLREVLQQEIEKLDREINEFDESGQQNEEFKRLDRDREKLEGFVREWNNNPRKLFADSFEELDALCQQEEQKEQLRQVCLDGLKRFSQSLNSEEFVKIVEEWSRNHPDIKLLLVIDQFEELITLSRDEEQDKKNNKQPEWQQFLKFLEEVIAANLKQLRIVVTLRSDFEPRFLNSDVLKSQWAKARFPVRAMRADELRQAIERPAAEMALYFEPANLVDRLIEEVGQMPGALPLLSFTLSEFYIKLYEKWVKDGSSDRALRIDADFEKEGGVAGSLTRRANQEYNELPDDAHRATMRRVMLRMVTLEGGEPVRRRVSLSELVYANKQEPNQPDKEENQRVEVVLECLHNTRLVVSGQETGEPYIEPAHDFLVKGWDKLQKWLEKEQENLLLQRRLTTVAFEWKKKEQASSVLGKAEPFLTSLDKKIDSTEEWLKQIKDREVQQVIQKRQVQLQQASTKWKSNEKISIFLTKAEPVFEFLNKIFGFPENWPTKIKPQNSQERQREKKVQFLWNGNPYLDVLRKTLKSSDYWFNQVEAEFVQQSIWQRRRNVNLRWGIATGVIILSSGLTVWALIGQKQALIEHMSANQNSTENELGTNQPILEALISSLRAGKPLKHWLLHTSILPPHADRQQQIQVITTLRKAVSQVRELYRWQLPQGEVLDIFFSQDGQIFVAIQKDKNDICVWDSQTKACNPLPRQDLIVVAKFSPNGKILAILSQNQTGKDRTVRLWNLGSKQFEYELHGLQGSASLEDQRRSAKISFSHDGKRLAIEVAKNEDASERFGYLWWNLESKKPYLLPNSHLLGMSFKSNDNLLIATLNDTNKSPYVAVLNWPSGQVSRISPMAKIPDEIYNANFSANGTKVTFVSSAGDFSSSEMWVWDLNKNQWVNVEAQDLNQVHTSRFSADGKLLVAINQDRSVYLYKHLSVSDSVGANILGKFNLPQGALENMMFSPDGKQFITQGDDGILRLWDVDLPYPKTEPKFSLEGIESISFNPNGQTIATIATDTQGTVRLWNLVGNQLQEFPKVSGKIASLSFSPNGKQLVTGGENGFVQFWDLHGNILKEFKAYPSNPVKIIGWAQNGQSIATIKIDEYNKDTIVHLWSLNGQKLDEFTVPFNEPSVGSIHFQSNGTLKAIYTHGGGDIVLWDSSGKSTTLNTKNIEDTFLRTSINFNADGSLFATALGSDVAIWDLQGEQLMKFEGYIDRIKSVSFSADDSKLAVVGEDGKVQLWQLGGLDELLQRGCERARKYLATLDEKNSDRNLCDGIGNSQR